MWKVSIETQSELSTTSTILFHTALRSRGRKGGGRRPTARVRTSARIALLVGTNNFRIRRLLRKSFPLYHCTKRNSLKWDGPSYFFPMKPSPSVPVALHQNFSSGWSRSTSKTKHGIQLFKSCDNLARWRKRMRCQPSNNNNNDKRDLLA
jgi:hypothetical protein